MDKILKKTSILSWREQKPQFSKALFSINSRNLPWKTDLFPRVNFNVFDKSLLERKEKDIEFCFFQDPDQACVSASEMAYPLFLLQLLQGHQPQTKGQLNSEWIYEVIVSPKMPTKN